MNRKTLVRMIVFGLLLLVVLPVSSIIYQKNHSLSSTSSVASLKPIGQITDQQALFDIMPQEVINSVDAKVNYFIVNDGTYQDFTYHVAGEVSVQVDGDLANTYQFKMTADNDARKSFTVNTDVRSFNGTFVVKTYVNGKVLVNSATSDNPSN